MLSSAGQLEYHKTILVSWAERIGMSMVNGIDPERLESSPVCETYRETEKQSMVPVLEGSCRLYAVRQLTKIVTESACCGNLIKSGK